MIGFIRADFVSVRETELTFELVAHNGR